MSPCSYDRLSLQQAVAEGYGGYSTLRRRVTTGQLPSERLGRRIMVRRAHLEALVGPASADDLQAQLEQAAERAAAAAPQLSEATRERLRELLGGLL